MFHCHLSALNSLCGYQLNKMESWIKTYENDLFHIQYICCRTLTLSDNFDIISKNTAEERSNF